MPTGNRATLSNEARLGEAWTAFADQLKALGLEALESAPN